ncbi:MAG: hypothetical protein ACI90V_005567 [Bacillariaceae sp.]|jgi:hypothetical protein
MDHIKQVSELEDAPLKIIVTPLLSNSPYNLMLVHLKSSTALVDDIFPPLLFSDATQT